MFNTAQYFRPPNINSPVILAFCLSLEVIPFSNIPMPSSRFTLVTLLTLATPAFAESAASPVEIIRPAIIPVSSTQKQAPAATLKQSPITLKAAKTAAAVQPPAISPWRVSAGYVWRNLGGLHFNSNARAQGYSLPAFDTSNPGAAGNADGTGNHTYRDSFVYSDVSGPSSPDTWYWGYQNNSQLVGNDLATHGTATLYSQHSSVMSHPGWSDNMSGGGPFLALDWDGIEVKPGLRLGAEFAVSLIETNQGNTFQSLFVQRQALTAQITDHYTVDPFAIPGAPFSSTFAGPGPIIPSHPNSREVISVGPGTDANTTTFFDQISERLDLTLTTLSLGPTVNWQHGRFTTSASLGLALNIASWDADKSDALYRRHNGSTALLARWHDHRGGTDVLPGFYLQASVAYAINAKWSVQAFGRYDWSEELEGNVGGSHFSLDLSGWSVGAGLVYRF